MGNDALLPQETGEQWCGKHGLSAGQRNLLLSIPLAWEIEIPYPRKGQQGTGV